MLLASATLSAGQQSAAPTSIGADGRSTLRPTTARSIAGTRIETLTVIGGSVLDSANGRLAYTVVRLRDARFGRIVDTELTDASGLFEFRAIDPGSYIVEVMGNDSSVVAVSQILKVNAGDVVSVVVKLPSRMPSFASILGAVGPQAAALILTQAAASGVAAVVPTAPVSPIE